MSEQQQPDTEQFIAQYEDFLDAAYEAVQDGRYDVVVSLVDNYKIRIPRDWRLLDYATDSDNTDLFVFLEHLLRVSKERRVRAYRYAYQENLCFFHRLLHQVYCYGVLRRLIKEDQDVFLAQDIFDNLIDGQNPDKEWCKLMQDILDLLSLHKPDDLRRIRRLCTLDINREKALLNSVHNRDSELLKVVCPDNPSEQALLKAAREGKPEIVSLLLRKKEYGKKSLTNAATQARKHGHQELARQIDDYRKNPFSRRCCCM